MHNEEVVFILFSSFFISETSQWVWILSSLLASQ